MRMMLPVELVEMIADYVKPAVTSREAAEARREELMAERSNFVITHTNEVFEVSFNLCEH